MPQVKENKARENRITMEIIVDAYTPEEQAMGWYYYLEEKLNFPFKAKCVEARAVSPLAVGEKVEVVGMPPESECRCEMFVSVEWEGRELAVPLSQLQAIRSDAETKEAIADWHYWTAQGYEFLGM